MIDVHVEASDSNRSWWHPNAGNEYIAHRQRVRIAQVLREARTLQAYGPTADIKDCANREISGMVVARRVSSPRSVRQQASAADVCKCLRCKRLGCGHESMPVKHGLSTSRDAQDARAQSLLVCWKLQH